MDNCLVTKLKGSVNNPNLTKLGCFRLSITKEEGVSDTDRTALSIQFNNTGGTTLLKVVKGDGHIAFSGSDLINNPSTELVVNGSEYKDVFFENENFEVEVENKGKLKLLSSRSGYKKSIIGTDISAFKYYETPIEVSIVGNNWYGDIEGLKSSQKIYVNATKISGDISCFTGKSVNTSRTSLLTLSNSPLLTGNINALASTVASGVEVKNTDIFGTVESFAALLAQTHISGTFTVDVIGTKVTYNGSVPTGVLTITFTGEGNYVIA